MILEQAIDRYTNNAEYERIHGSLQGCMEFRQLAEWLKDYKRLLEQQPVTTTNNDEPITVIYPTIVCDDAISREAVLKKIDYEVEHYCKYLEEVDDKRNAQTHVALVSDNIREEVEQLPPVTQKLSEDMPCITPEEMQRCKDIVKKYTPKQEACDEVVSRQAALNSLIDNTHLDGYDLAEALDAIENKEKLPSVTQKSAKDYLDMADRKAKKIKDALTDNSQKYGKWIVIDDCEQFIAKCSECGRLYDSRLISKYPYCHCGAKMFDPQESEEV